MIIPVPYLIFIIVVCFQYCKAAGVATHLSLLTRIIDENNSEYSPWLKAGAFFPDSLYSCLPDKNWQQLAEFIHWPKFTMIALHYWREKYSSDGIESLSNDSMHLKWFIKGIFTHQILDSSWHSLVDNYQNDGLLKVISEVEFDGNINEAHNFLDTIGDFYTLHSWVREESVDSESWGFFTENDWSLPKEEDLLEIIKRTKILKHPISYLNLKMCLQRGHSAIISEVLSIRYERKTVLKESIKRYPQVMELLHDYWMGGEWNNIAMIRNCVDHIENFFHLANEGLELNEHNIRLCGNLPTVLEIREGKKLTMSTSENGANIISPWNEFANFGSSMIVGDFMGDGEQYLAVSSPIEDNFGGLYMIPWSIASQINIKETVIDKPFAKMFGSKVDKFSLGNLEYLIVSEPGTNILKFFLYGDLILSIKAPTNMFLKQMEIGAVADITGDGVPDLLLSIPYSGKQQEGDVYFIDGQLILFYILNGRKYQNVHLQALRPISLKGHLKLDKYAHFGNSIAVSVSDFDSKRVFISAPNTRSIIVLEYKSQLNEFMIRSIIDEDTISLYDKNKMILKTSSRVTGMFGKVLYTWKYNGRNMIAVSQHLFNTVYIYEDLPLQILFLGKIMLQYSLDDAAYSNGFATSIAYNPFDKHLYFTSPNSFGGSGAIFKVNCSYLLIEPFKEIELSRDNLYFSNIINPGKGMSGFGKELVVSHDGRIVVGIPQLGYGNIYKQQLTGAIMVI